MTQIEAVAKFLRRISEAHIIEQQAKGIYASGRSAKSLREVTRPDGGDVLGLGYIYYQKNGRRPARSSSLKTKQLTLPPVDAIEQWIKDKGIVPDDPETSTRSLAFAIARKIANKGTDIFQRKRPGIEVEDEITEARKELKIDYLQIKKTELINKYKDLARVAQQ
jgi:hypothetical protein